MDLKIEAIGHDIVAHITDGSVIVASSLVYLLDDTISQNDEISSIVVYHYTTAILK